MTSGKRNKQIVLYDPTVAEKINENRGSGSRDNNGERNPHYANRGDGSRGNGDLERGNHENNILAEERRDPPPNPQPRYEPRQEREVRPTRHNQANERYNDGYSNVGYAGHGGNNHYGMRKELCTEIFHQVMQD